MQNLASTTMEHEQDSREADTNVNKCVDPVKQPIVDVVSAQFADLSLFKEELASANMELQAQKLEVACLRRSEAEAKARTQQLLVIVEELRNEAPSRQAQSQVQSPRIREQVDGMCAEFHKDQIVTLQGQLNEVRDELNSAIVKTEMQAMDHEQEMKRVKWEHELERNRLQWDHEQETDRLAWDHKQTMMRVMPTAQKMQKELENVTARLLDSQEDMRALQATTEATERKHKLEIAKWQVRVMELTKEHDEEREQWEEKLECQECTPVSPTKSALCNICMDKAVKMVFPCGHAKCQECASRLVGLDQGCPDCRAPLGQPQLLFLSVG